MIRVGVIGASGLAGGELIRLALQHPRAEVTFLGGSGNVGKRLPQLHPGLRIDLGITVEAVDPDVVAERCDVVFLATPAPVSARLAEQLADRVACLIDLSGAFRIKGEQAHQRWYSGVQRSADLSERFVYGVPELVSAAMVDAPLISLPGCFATAITLALHPLVTELGLDLGHVLVDGKTGSSGGGLSLRPSDVHAMRDGGVTPYAPTGHRHAAEVSRVPRRFGARSNPVADHVGLRRLTRTWPACQLLRLPGPAAGRARAAADLYPQLSPSPVRAGAQA